MGATTFRGVCPTLCAAPLDRAAASRYDATVSFREILQDELRRRCARNPRYSLRAFARSLGRDHSSLSQLLRGRRRITTRVIRRIGMLLRLPLHEIELYCAEENDVALARIVGTDLFRADSRRLASVLGISIDEVNVSLQRLLRLGALRMTAADRWEVPDAQPRRAMADRRA